MSNKAHLRPHRKKRQASRTTGLLLVILFAALVALATAMAASGHALPAGRIIPLRGGRRTVGGRLQFDTVRCRPGRTAASRSPYGRRCAIGYTNLDPAATYKGWTPTRKIGGGAVLAIGVVRDRARQAARAIVVPSRGRQGREENPR